MKTWFRCCMVLLAACVGPALQAEQVQVAVASNFIKPMEAIAARFEADTGHELRLSFGASGSFHAQIVNGAPFAVLLSADSDIPLALENSGAAIVGTRFTYATGRLVLWSREVNAPVQEARLLREDNFGRLSIANPRLAPYGRAAVDVLQALDLEAAMETRTIFGESISQAFQFVQTGSAAAGFIALAQVSDGNGGIGSGGSAWLVPERLHAPIRQDAVLLTPGKDSAAARQLLAYLRSEKAREIIAAYGYGVEE